MKHAARRTPGLSFIAFLLRVIVHILCTAPLREATIVFKEFTQSALVWESFNRTEVLPTPTTGTNLHDVHFLNFSNPVQTYCFIALLHIFSSITSSLHDLGDTNR